MTNQKGVAIGELLAVIAVAAIVALIIYFSISDRGSSDETPTPSPSQSSGPTPSASAFPTLSYSPLPNTTRTPNPTRNPSISGIRGTVTITNCVSDNCTKSVLANVEIPVKNSQWQLLTTLKSDANGRFSLSIAPGNYIVGPVREPSSGYSLSEVYVTVRAGAMSDVDVSFRSDK